MSTDMNSQMLNSQTYLENIIEIIPYFIFWKNVDSVYLGCNQKFAVLVGENSPKDVVGKTDFDLGWSKEEAELFLEGDKKTMSGLPTINTEEILIQPDGSKIVMLVNKVPLLDADGQCIGILGTSTDITQRKQAEERAEREAEKARELKLENDRQQIALKEQEKFAQLARKVAHDINSPLASLKMLLPMCTELHETKRTLLNRATEGILDIANNLLSNYHKQKPATSEIEPRQHLLVSDLLIQLLSEKKMQYRNRPVTLDTVITSDAHFAFISTQPTEFRRSMSNLINNAVDALEGSMSGKVTIQLTVNTASVMVKIQDNGKGMNAGVIEKMQKRQSFTEGKENGHGLGLQQVWDTLEYNQGVMGVQSTPDKGTLIQLTFPRVDASDWIAQEIHLTHDNIIVILDDDESIHTAWDLRFTQLLRSYPTLRIHHFTQGQDALDFVANLRQKEKDLVVFLSDYELLQQGRNGLEVVKESGIKSAILVTSYYGNPKIREKIDQLGIKMLPKQMASIIPIIFGNDKVLSDVNNLQIPALSRELAFKTSLNSVAPKHFVDKEPALQKTHIVLLDDNQTFADSVIFRLSHNKVVTHYLNPLIFLGECDKYTKDTPICIDNNFGLVADIKGTQVAERLHALQFRRLFIVSGDQFEPGALPDYVTVIFKTDLEPLDKL